MEAQSQVSKAVDILCSLEEKKWESTQRFIDSFIASGTFKDVQMNKNESDERKFIRTISQFYQVLCDNIRQRFTCIEFLSNIQVLDKSNWPDDKVERTLYGDQARIHHWGC